MLGRINGVAKNGIKNGAKNGAKSSVFAKSAVDFNDLEEVLSVLSTPVSTKFGGANDKLIGPRPTGSQLANESQIPNFTPTNAREALFSGSRYYENKAGETVGLRQVDNPRRQSPDPLSHGNTEKVGSRRNNRNSTDPNMQRASKEDRQTLGKRDFYEGSKQGTDAHHNMGLDQYDPFFEDLSTREQKQLAKHIQDTHNRVLGSRKENRLDLPKNVHNILHIWETLTMAKLSRGRLNMANRSMKERMLMADTYIEQIQPAYEEMAFKLMQNANLPDDELMAVMLQDIDS